MPGMVIIGAGECGVRAAFTLREKGYAGSVTLIGDEAGTPYERPPLSKDAQQPRKAIRSDEAFVEAGIDYRHGIAATKLDPASKTVLLSDGTSVAYDKLLLATGAKARLFPGMDGCLTLRTHVDALRIAPLLTAGQRIGIVGGGFIGLELAAMARQNEAAVTVIEAGPRILGRAIPKEIAAVMHARHEAAGVSIRTSTGVSSATNKEISLSDGTVMPFDTVIAGVGSLPNTALAEEAGLRVSNGVVVDESFRSSDPLIFAAGDCCNFTWRGERVRLESWKAAQDQGAHAGAAMLGVDDAYSNVPWFWSDQYDLTAQVAGIFDLSSSIDQRQTGGSTVIVFQCDPDGRLRAAAGVGQGNAVAKEMKVLEKLIERNASVDPVMVRHPATNLKRLLKGD